MSHFIPNSTQIPNIFIDFVMAKIGNAEFKCLAYIARRTYGFGRDCALIPLTQFTDGLKSTNGRILDYGTGLERPTVIKALKFLVAVKVVEVVKFPAGNSYQINLAADLSKLINKKEMEDVENSLKEDKKRMLKLFEMPSC